MNNVRVEFRFQSDTRAKPFRLASGAPRAVNGAKRCVAGKNGFPM